MQNTETAPRNNFRSLHETTNSALRAEFDASRLFSEWRWWAFPAGRRAFVAFPSGWSFITRETALAAFVAWAAARSQRRGFFRQKCGEFFLRDVAVLIR